MPFIADLHIHSHFSVATSKDLKPEFLDYWARIKGIRVVGTGDFTHPSWLCELKEKLEPAEPGLFRLKKAYRIAIPFITKEKDIGFTRFLLSGEISNIYKKSGKVRKVHNVILSPDFETAERIQQELLKKKFNITSDGRPILGMDSRDLLELSLSCNEAIFFIPAHIWTPWFSALGAQSGFDSISDCYTDLTQHIYAVETGLSSDPPMNWRCSFLDRFTLVSNSDAHSPEKLGRNANIFDTELSYAVMMQALQAGDPTRFLGTIDFYPQEGKYHYAGHRKCGICWDPEETTRNRGICPVCNKPVTMGVLNRVAELADREDVSDRPNRLHFHSLIPLKEILSEIKGSGPESKQITQAYQQMIRLAGNEFNVLLNDSLEQLAQYGSPALVEAIRRMRAGEVLIRPGFDGEFGQIRVFGHGEAASFMQRESLFETDQSWQGKTSGLRKAKSGKQTAKAERKVAGIVDPLTFDNRQSAIDNIRAKGENPEQQQAIEHFKGPALVLAGPGTGKTRVLTRRIVHLINRYHVPPSHILGITFTNKAAGEMHARMKTLVAESHGEEVTLVTFHQLGYNILNEHADKTGRTHPFSVIEEEEKRYLLIHEIGIDRSLADDIAQRIGHLKQETGPGNAKGDITGHFNRYQSYLRDNSLFDLDDLIYETVRVFHSHPDILESYQQKYQWILIDEYQDINRAQYELIRLLMPDPGSNLFAIGDPHQAIYGFRGADVVYINRFLDDFPGAVQYGLKQSYRCSNQILQASGQVISGSDNQSPLLLGIIKNVKIRIVSHPTDRSEAEFVARTIEQMMGGLRFFSIDSQVSSGEQQEDINGLSDFAVLCRIGRQMGLIERAFDDHSIPFQKIAEDPFFHQKPVHTIIGMLKLARHPMNRLLYLSLSKEEGIVPFTPEQLTSFIRDKGVQDAIRMIAASFFRQKPNPNDPDIKRLLAHARDYDDSLEAFLRFVALGVNTDTYQPYTEHVSLMTLHASKGLEFPCVFIVGCEEGLIPYSLLGKIPSDPQEEKRLLYVGMTRAKTYLYMSHALKRSLMGKTYNPRRSPFLDAIEKELIEHHWAAGKQTKNKDQLSLF